MTFSSKPMLDDFCTFLNQAVSPYHTVELACRRLTAAGFTELPLSQPWQIQPGGRYYVRCFDTALAAFAIAPQAQQQAGSFRLAACHTDWPGLRVKPNPEQVAASCCKLNIEPYGGAIYASWLDRPLSIAGVITRKGERPLAPQIQLFDWGEPLLTIPNVAIHLNREINNGLKLNPAVDLLPLLSSVSPDWLKTDLLLQHLAQRLGLEKTDILDYDLYVYNAEPACVLGLEKEFLSAPRLDNQSSVYACLQGLINSQPRQGVNGIVLCDNEEVGSRSKQGADSATLKLVLEKLRLSLGWTQGQYLDALSSGLLLSLDVAHAVHPNHSELSDSSCQALLNQGCVIKRNYSQRYPTDARGNAIAEALCQAHGIACQKFMNRADQAGGSTLGALLSPLLPMRCIDAGVPLLAMHSARELMGTQDLPALLALITALFEAD